MSERERERGGEGGEGRGEGGREVTVHVQTCIKVYLLFFLLFLFPYIYRQREKSKQTDGTPLSLFNMFVDRVRDQLHIVLAMSPIGEAFRNRLRQFPSLVNCCTIDWFQSWPNDALTIVAQRFLEDVEMEDTAKEGCVEMCKEFHQSTRSLSDKFLDILQRHNYVTPTSYLELISTYKTLLSKKRS